MGSFKMVITGLEEFIEEAEGREEAIHGALYAAAEVARRLRAIIAGPTHDRLDGMSIEGHSPAPPPDLPTVSETIEQHKGPWYNPGISSSRDMTPDSLSEYFYREEDRL